MANLRADARANRDRILAVAREALAEDPDASLNSIAQEAGVGPGTLYRHFPTREALVLAIYRTEIDALVTLASALLARHPPLEALRLWCSKVNKLGRTKHGLANTLQAAMSQDEVRATYQPMLEAVGALLGACERAGQIRRGTDPEDVLTIIGLLWRIPPTPEGEARVKRLVALILRGLAPGDAQTD